MNSFSHRVASLLTLCVFPISPGIWNMQQSSESPKRVWIPPAGASLRLLSIELLPVSKTLHISFCHQDSAHAVCPALEYLTPPPPPVSTYLFHTYVYSCMSLSNLSWGHFIRECSLPGYQLSASIMLTENAQDLSSIGTSPFRTAYSCGPCVHRSNGILLPASCPYKPSKNIFLMTEWVNHTRGSLIHQTLI